MSSAYEKYRELERRLAHVRWVNQGYDSPEEERIFEEMHNIWWEMTEQERTKINGEPPRTLIRKGRPQKPSHRVVDHDVRRYPDEPPRRISDGAA
jgi:hypothetical protein